MYGCRHTVKNAITHNLHINYSSAVGVVYSGLSVPSKNRQLRRNLGPNCYIWMLRRKQNVSLKEYKEVLHLDPDRKGDWRSAIKTFQKYQEWMLREVIGVLDYDDIQVDEVEEKKEQFDFRSYRNSNALILVKIMNWDGGRGFVVSKADVRIYDLMRNRGILIYGEEDERYKLEKVAEILYNQEEFSRLMNSNYYTRRSNPEPAFFRNFNVIQIARSNWKYLPVQHNHNCLHVNEVLQGRMKEMGRIATAHKIAGMFLRVEDGNKNLYNTLRTDPNSFRVLEYCISDIGDEIGVLHRYIQSRLRFYSDLSSHLDDLEMAEQVGNLDFDMLKKAEDILAYLDGIPCLPVIIINSHHSHPSVTDKSREAVLEAVRCYNKAQKCIGRIDRVKKINSEYYFNKKYKDQWSIESQE
jgi:hypothetical protein